MKKLLLIALGVAALVGLISCGGSGSAPLSPTGRALQNMQRFSLLSMANAGILFPGFGGSGGGGTTGSGGGGIPSMGGFIRNFGGVNGVLPALVRRIADGGTTGGTGGSTGGQDFYYDEWLQLWVDTQWTENTFVSHFYLDQAETQPAGSLVCSFTSDWNVYPQTYSSQYEFTAGLLAGAHGNYDCSFVTQLDGAMTYDNTYADTSHDSGTSTWTIDGSVWGSRWDGPNGTGWYQDHGDWSASGSGEYACSNSDGWASTWHTNADGSGSAHFEGPDPRLPADLTWTASGHFRATYADGTSEEWTWEDLWSGEGSGTTGSGGFMAPVSLK